MIRGLVFDFDGLILDTEHPVYESWAEIYRAHGQRLPIDVWHEIIGRGRNVFDPHAYLERLVGGRLDRDAIRARQRSRFFELLDTEPRPGIRAWIREARQRHLGLAVASSSDRQWVDGNLRRLGLGDSFDCLITSDDAARTKPDPEIFLRAARGLALSPDQCMALEDSPNGVSAAKAAGMFTIAVPCDMTADLNLSEADRVLPSLTASSLHEALLHALRVRKGQGQGAE